jgi:hypothetical protein
MLTSAGHLTYCTNIHPGESWAEHFQALKNYFPSIKEKISPDQPMGIGLRLSGEASMDLIKKENLVSFKKWLASQQAYVFTMNGFPYGGFHRTVVKDMVHAPDWTKQERVDYTVRLFHILSALLPADLDGGVSTSPLSYKPWFQSHEDLNRAKETATKNIIFIVEKLIDLHQSTNKLLHLDIEPEPDGVLSNGTDFIEWFENDLVPVGIPIIKERFHVSHQHAEDLIKEHLRLCYDVCHFAVGFEDHLQMIDNLQKRRIKIGKIQISAALKAQITEIKMIKESFAKFNEPTYLHQVVAKTTDGKLLHFPDLPVALKDNHSQFAEWRAHFHVPVFTEKFGLLSSTNDEIGQVLFQQKKKPFTQHLEVETYTWDVLPAGLKLPLQDSIVRELQWVKRVLANE